MNIIELKIGRDADNGSLVVITGGKKIKASKDGCVPLSVSREHAGITVSDQGRMLIENLNIENSLYVNSTPVERKVIAHGDRIELGSNHYKLSWDIIDKFFQLADIRPLEEVWNTYQAERLNLQIKERRFGVLRSATGILTTAAMVLGLMELGGGAANSLRVVLYAVSFAVTLVFFIIAWRSASRMPIQQQQLEEQTRHSYCCPNCHSMLNMQSYELLRQQKKCPHCGAIFIK